MAHFSHAINCALSLSRSERAERLHEPKAHALNETKFVRLAAEASMQPPTNVRMPTLQFVCVSVLPWLRCCCCCWFLLEGASCKAKLVACGCERTASSSSVFTCFVIYVKSLLACNAKRRVPQPSIRCSVRVRKRV